jgi:hypothetical protein
VSSGVPVKCIQSLSITDSCLIIFELQKFSHKKSNIVLEYFFIFGMSHVQISTRAPAILTGISWFSSVPPIDKCLYSISNRLRRFPFTYFPIHYLLPSNHSTLYDLSDECDVEYISITVITIIRNLVEKSFLRSKENSCASANQDISSILWNPKVRYRVDKRSSIFWDISPCSLLKVNLSFGGICRLHLQGRRTSQARNQHEACSKQSPLLDLLFGPEI